MSVRDSLTGLYTSDFFWEEARRISDGRYAPIGILVFDLDGLKLINDTFGNPFLVVRVDKLEKTNIV